VSAAFALAACGLLIASTLQSSTGFGFALVAGPVLYAAVEPAAAVGLVLVLGQVVNLLVLFGERRWPDPDWRAVAPAVLAALPGLPVGALLVRTLPTSTLRVTVGLVVFVLVVARVARRVQRPRRPAARENADLGRAGALLAGLSVGILTTSTTTSGPPLAIWLTGRRLVPAAVRDTVTAIFFALDFVGIGIVVAVVGVGPSLARAEWLPLLVPLAVAGQVLGRQIFLRLPARYYERVVLTFAVVAGALSVATGVV
jgi:hypothetical protein